MEKGTIKTYQYGNRTFTCEGDVKLFIANDPAMVANIFGSFGIEGAESYAFAKAFIFGLQIEEKEYESVALGGAKSSILIHLNKVDDKHFGALKIEKAVNQTLTPLKKTIHQVIEKIMKATLAGKNADEINKITEPTKTFLQHKKNMLFVVEVADLFDLREKIDEYVLKFIRTKLDLETIEKLHWSLEDLQGMAQILHIPGCELTEEGSPKEEREVESKEMSTFDVEPEPEPM